MTTEIGQLPVGAFLTLARDAAGMIIYPEGYLPCDGRSHPREKYPELAPLMDAYNACQGYPPGKDASLFRIPLVPNVFVRALPPNHSNDRVTVQYVYCTQHCRVHETGWCTVPIHEKILLAAQTLEEAEAEWEKRREYISH